MKIQSLDASDAGACARTAQMILQYHRPVPFGLPDENLNIRWKMVDWMYHLWTLQRTGGGWTVAEVGGAGGLRKKHSSTGSVLALQQGLSWVSKSSSRCPPRFPASALAQGGTFVRLK